MPLTKLQSHILRLLASHRDLNSFVAGGIALNREGLRYSRDIDLFHDSVMRLEKAATEDAEAIARGGFGLRWTQILTGKREAEIEGLGDQVRLKWVHDSAFRFFPAQRDELFGYVLHPADLATNKVSAAANRREPRDIVDLLTIHHDILSLGAAVTAAVGRFPGQSPEEMLAEIRRNSRFTFEDFTALSLAGPINPSEIHQGIRIMLEDAEAFVNRLPSDAVGYVYLQDGQVVEPDQDHLESYERRSGGIGGVWPSSQGIYQAMLDKYKQ